MDQHSILFQFPDRRSAYYAFDTLEELGYKPVMSGGEHTPFVHVHIDNTDLTSALEIAQSYGGTLIQQDVQQEAHAYESAYQLPTEDMISIPAHMVNEDLTEDYMQGDSFSADVRI